MRKLLPRIEFPPSRQRYGEFRHCPRCGTAFRAEDFRESECMLSCSSCDFDFYQNPVPAAVTVVRDPSRRDHVLVLKRRTPPNIGLWCVPGGFIRYGEPPEETAVREALEEVGLPVRIERLLRAGLVDYTYRGRQICILEIAYVAMPLAPLPEGARRSEEASAIEYRPVDELIARPQLLAFPEQAEVLRDYRALPAGGAQA